MLNDPRMTNSTSIEGYSASGSLHYAPYTNDPRDSHAHGWSTGPTSLLFFYVAGIHLTSSSGQTPSIAAQPGDLTFIETGFVTSLDSFSTSIKATGGHNGTVTSMDVVTLSGTTGTVSLPGVTGKLKNSSGKSMKLVDGKAQGLVGGSWTFVVG